QASRGQEEFDRHAAGHGDLVLAQMRKEPGKAAIDPFELDRQQHLRPYSPSLVSRPPCRAISSVAARYSKSRAERPTPTTVLKLSGTDSPGTSSGRKSRTRSPLRTRSGAEARNRTRAAKSPRRRSCRRKRNRFSLGAAATLASPAGVSFTMSPGVSTKASISAALTTEIVRPNS